MLCRALPRSAALSRTLTQSAALCRILPHSAVPASALCNSSSHALHALRRLIAALPNMRLTVVVTWSGLSLCNSSSQALSHSAALCRLIAALPNMRLTVVVTCLASRSVTALRKLCRSLSHSAALHRTLPSQQAPDCGCYLPCLSLCNSSSHALSRSAALCRILRFLPHSVALCRICSTVFVMLPLLCVHCIAMRDVSFSAVFW
jgi:hypothetical protein